MNKLLQSITTIGISDSLSYYETKQIKGFNTATLLLLIGLLFSLSTNIIHTSWWLFDSVLYFGGFILILSTFILQYFQYHKTAKFFSFYSFTILIFIISLIGASIFIGSLVSLILLALAFVIYENPKSVIAFAVFQYFLLCLAIFLIPNISYDHEVSAFNAVNRFVIVSTTYWILFFISQFINRQLHDYDKKNKDLIGALQLQNEEMAKAYNDMENFVYVVSHDLKAPLRVINNFAQLIDKNIESGKTQNIQEYANFINISGSKLSEMIDDVLEYSKLSSNKTINLEVVELKDIITEIEAELLMLFPNVKIKYDDVVSIYGNRSNIKMLFQNLIENGCKYNKNEQPTIIIQSVQNKFYQLIKITDNGIGIPKDKQNHVFNLFARLHADHEYEGTGIGLANCKKIIEEHLNGKIEIQSDEGIGTTMSLYIPMVRK